MNILMILTNSFDPDPRVLKEAKALINKGHSVTIFAWDRDNRYLDKKSEEISGIHVIRFFEEAEYGSGFSQIKSFLKFCLSAKRKARGINYDVIHAHDIDGAIVAIYINKKKKIIWDMHEFYDGFNYSFFKKTIYEFLAGLSFRRVAAIIYVVESQKSRYAPKIKAQTVQSIVMNCPEEDVFSDFKREKSNKVRIAFIGSVREYDTLKIMIEQVEKYADIQFYIHGTGIKLDVISELAKEYNNTIVTGKFDYSNIKKLYENTDIVYSVYDSSQTNIKEAFPVKGFESIMTETPIIASKNTDFGDLVEKHDIGFTVNETSPEDICKVLDSIIANRNIIDRKSNNIKKISKSYTWKSQAQNLIELYSKLD